MKKGADQTVHPHRLVSAVVVCIQQSQFFSCQDPNVLGLISAHTLKQFRPFIMLCLGSIGMNSVTSESCSRGINLKRIIGK